MNVCDREMNTQPAFPRSGKSVPSCAHKLYTATVPQFFNAIGGQTLTGIKDTISE